jgi:hypothetical protein
MGEIFILLSLMKDNLLIFTTFFVPFVHCCPHFVYNPTFFDIQTIAIVGLKILCHLFFSLETRQEL